jgi:cephalosporin hydroxylase
VEPDDLGLVAAAQEETIPLAPPRVAAAPNDLVREYWDRRVRQSLLDRYAGIPLVKLPEDLRVYEHIMWATRPDVVIEIGVYGGGSALWFRDRLRTLEQYGRTKKPLVVSIDVDIAPAAAALKEIDSQYEQTILLVKGDVCDESLPDRIRAQLPASARCLVVDDSAHTYETTRAALRGFSQFVPPGGFFVVEDGCVDVEDLRVDPDWPRGVLPALREWLATEAGQAFVVRRDLEAYGLSTNHGGFLQRR